MSYTVTAKQIVVPFLFQTTVPKLGDLNAQAYQPANIGFVQATVTGPAFWELRILVSGASVSQPPLAYGWGAGAATLDIPKVFYGNDYVPVFKVPATFDANGNVKTYAPVTLRASFYDVSGGTLLTTVDTGVN